MSIAELGCVTLAVLAVTLWVGPSPRRLLARHGIGPVPPDPTGQRRTDEHLAGFTAPARAGPPGHPRTGRSGRSSRRTSAAPAAWQCFRSWLSAVGRARGQATRRRALTVELCTAAAAELRAGAMPTQAAARAVGSLPGLCDEVARVAALGGDVVGALRAAARHPGAEGLGHLAVAWSVSELTGSGLAPACDRVAGVLRDEQALRREVSAQLAGARATARLLGVLPLFGLVLGAGIGGRPWEFLLGTPYGLGCLTVGLVLVAVGLWWTERLVRSVEDRI